MGRNSSQSPSPPLRKIPSQGGSASPKPAAVARNIISPPISPRPSKIIELIEPESPLTKRYQKIDKSDKNLRNPSFEVRMRHLSQALEPRAKLRNRYDNVLPTSTDIVSLIHPTSKETAYINASRFGNMIITQGPFIRGNINTCPDFWMLVFEQGSKIVCLTDPFVINTSGREEEKTFPYWEPRQAKRIPDPSEPEIVFKQNVGPEGQEVNLEVRLVEEPLIVVEANNNEERVTKRTFEIKFGEQVKRITHWYFENWEDHTVCDPQQLARLIELLLENPGDPIIHCSAGLGRSGVFAIILKFIIRFIESGETPSDDEIDDAVIDLRQRRPGAVQTRDQLLLISDTIEAFIDRQAEKE